MTDIRRSIRALHGLTKNKRVKLILNARSTQGFNALYASLLEGSVAGLELHELPSSHMDDTAPAYLNILKHLDIPQAVAWASETIAVKIHGGKEADWPFPISTARQLGWKNTALNGLEIVGADTR